LLRFLFFNGLVRLLAVVLLGLNVRHRERLPTGGPAILVANHNSHLDTLVLMTLLPARLLPRLKPVAAEDYFLKNRLLAWFARDIIGILPIRRNRGSCRGDPLVPLGEALDMGQILILFPEGTRGRPEHLSWFRRGIAHLAEYHPGVPVVPIYLHGLGKALPRGEALLVPFFCDVFVGEPLSWSGDRGHYLSTLESAMQQLAGEGHFPVWE